MAYTIEQVREVAKKKNIVLEEVSEYNDELMQRLSKGFTFSTNGLNVFVESKKTGKKKPLPIKNNSPHVFGNICVLNLTHFANFYMKNYDLEAQKEEKRKQRESEEMMKNETFFCTGCGMWHPISERKGYMWCGC